MYIKGTGDASLGAAGSIRKQPDIFTYRNDLYLPVDTRSRDQGYRDERQVCTSKEMSSDKGARSSCSVRARIYRHREERP